MANLARLRATWTGADVIGPGVSTFYFDAAASGFTAAVAAFFTSLGPAVPVGTTITVQNTGDILESTTGALTGVWTDGVVATINGSNNTGFTLGVGARVKWNTSGIHNRRRVHGSTFIVPLGKGTVNANGQLDSALAASITGYGNTLAAAAGASMRIWSRPVAGAGGAAWPVISATCPPAISWLRSRRN